MRLFLKSLIGFSLIIAAALVAGSFLPKHYTVERQIDIAATPAQIHQWVGDLSRWPEWTPWQDEDPTVTIETGEQTTGVGATQRWSGTDGSGSLTFTASNPASGIAYDINFGDGLHPATAEIRYAPGQDGTRVSWTIKGEFGIPGIGGWMAMLMQPALEGMFDRGLAKLKTVVEAEKS